MAFLMFHTTSAPTGCNGNSASHLLDSVAGNHAKLTPMRNPRLCLFTLSVIVSLTSCCAGALYKVKPAIDLPPMTGDVRSGSGGGVTLRAQPMLSDEETQDLFEANLLLAGVLPVRTDLEFESGVPVELKRARFRLKDGEGREWKLLPPKAAISRILSANNITLYNPNSRKQFEKEFVAYGIDLKTPLSDSDRRRTGFLFFQTPDKEPVRGPQNLTLSVEKLPQPVEIKLN